MNSAYINVYIYKIAMGVILGALINRYRLWDHSEHCWVNVRVDDLLKGELIKHKKSE
jgi:hypothetical protein